MVSVGDSAPFSYNAIEAIAVMPLYNIMLTIYSLCVHGDIIIAP